MTAFPLDDTYYLAQDMRLFHAGRTPGILNVTGNDFQVQANSGMNLTVKMVWRLPIPKLMKWAA